STDTGLISSQMVFFLMIRLNSDLSSFTSFQNSLIVFLFFAIDFESGGTGGEGVFTARPFVADQFPRPGPPNRGGGGGGGVQVGDGEPEPIIGGGGGGGIRPPLQSGGGGGGGGAPVGLGPFTV